MRSRRRAQVNRQLQTSHLGADAQRPPRGARRRLHRRERPRNASDHRGMPAEQDAGAQSRIHQAAITKKCSATILASPTCLWLKNGIAGDDTHGHVDDLARFVNPTTVVTIVEENRADANYAALQENLALLKSMKDQDGQPLARRNAADARASLFRRPAPARPATPISTSPTSIVLVPIFNDPNDRVALNTLAELFPGSRNRWRRTAVIWSSASARIHCMTQQLPASASSPALAEMRLAQCLLY